MLLKEKMLLNEKEWLLSDCPLDMKFGLLIMTRDAVRDNRAGLLPDQCSVSPRKMKLFITACRQLTNPKGKWRPLGDTIESWLHILYDWLGDNNSSWSERCPCGTRAMMLRDIIGNPFRPYGHPDRLFHDAWRGPDVLGIAQTIHDECRFGELPILADALLDRGCDDQAILDHLRLGGLHVRGCWVLDLVLDLE